MNVFIKEICLFSETEKRNVSLDSGLNIITGDSKTGKSALLEIVDYCLFSSRSTIPVGIITDFTQLYCIILKIKNKYLVIARPTWKDKKNRLKIYFSVESNDYFLTDFSRNYFKARSLKAYKAVQAEVEKHLGLSVVDTRQSIYEDKRGAGKATMRSFISLLFQHQNLIANKHSLFYRFDDFQKRKKTIDQFPILMGWADGEFYRLKQLLETKKKELAKETKIQKASKLTATEKIEKLKEPVKTYYTSIGYEWDDQYSSTIQSLRKIANNLPKVPRSSYEDSDIELQVRILKKQRRQIREELSNIKKLINQIDNNSEEANSYYQSLKHVLPSINIDKGGLTCPVCTQEVSNIAKKIDEAVNSKKVLLQELEDIGQYERDNSEHLSQLINSRDLLKNEIRTISTRISRLEKTTNNNKSLRDRLLILKGRIEEIIKFTDSKKEKEDLTNINALKDDIKDIELQISEYTQDYKLEEANEFLRKKMTDISERLDFEKELQPGVMRFDLKTFDFTYVFENQKIRLSEMGSGANWLACHLSLFLSLLHLTCKFKNSSIPSFLFIDQPSQVYFPKAGSILNKQENNDDKYDENIKQVKKIFNVLIEEVNAIKEEYGFSPQIIVLEHADEKEFNSYVKKRWSTDGDKLI